MKLGITTPVVVRLPGAHGEWEREAGPRALARIAEAADRLGYHHLTCSEHVAVPEEIAEVRGGTYWDPGPTLGYLAAHTRRIRLATQVLVLGYHHPLQLAKEYGTLDALSGGRVVLGLGVGSLREEFALLGAQFEGRGTRADEALRALRAALGHRVPEFRGETYRFEGMVVEPHAVQRRVPFWIGGRTRRSLRRAVELGDGWVPFGLPLERIAELLADAGTPAGFEVVLGPSASLDPLGEPGGCARALQRTRAAGATVTGVRLRAASVEHYVEQLEALREQAQDVGCEFEGTAEDGTRAG